MIASRNIIGILIATLCICRVAGQQHSLSLYGNTSFLELDLKFKPSLNASDLEQFVREFNKKQNIFELDTAIKTQHIDFSGSNYVIDQDILRPSIQNVFQSPKFQLGNYNNLEGAYRFKNPAFYEANRSSIMSFGVQDFVPPSGGTGF